jgi:putative flippase GtrA
MNKQLEDSVNSLYKLLFSKQFKRFVIFGFFCNLLGISSLYIFTDIFNFHYILSLIISLIWVNFIGFYLNKYYTFQTSPKTFFLELRKYYTVMSSAFVINLASLFILVDIFKIWYITAGLIVTIVLLFYNFTLHKYWSFRKKR